MSFILGFKQQFYNFTSVRRNPTIHIGRYIGRNMCGHTGLNGLVLLNKCTQSMVQITHSIVCMVYLHLGVYINTNDLVKCITEPYKSNSL